MRFNVGKKDFPKLGDVKHIKRFAWFPTRTTKNIVWLEYYFELWTFLQTLPPKIQGIQPDIVNEWVMCSIHNYEAIIPPIPPKRQH